MSITQTTTQTTATTPRKELVNIDGLRTSGIFPKGHEPCIRTLRNWTKRRRVPFVRVGRFVYFDPQAVEKHIHEKLLVPPNV